MSGFDPAGRPVGGVAAQARIAELEARVERLREEVDNRLMERDTAIIEVERLRAERDDYARTIKGLREGMKHRHAEIERLTRELRATLAHRDQWRRVGQSAEAEAERLRAALALRVPAAPPTWNSGGQHVVWITNDEDAEARKVLGSTPPLGGINRSDRARIRALLDGAA